MTFCTSCCVGACTWSRFLVGRLPHLNTLGKVDSWHQERCINLAIQCEVCRQWNGFEWLLTYLSICCPLSCACSCIVYCLKSALCLAVTSGKCLEKQSSRQKFNS